MSLFPSFTVDGAAAGSLAAHDGGGVASVSAVAGSLLVDRLVDVGWLRYGGSRKPSGHFRQRITPRAYGRRTS